MVLRKDDFTEEALNIGIWNTLCEWAGVDPVDEDGEVEVCQEDVA